MQKYQGFIARFVVVSLTVIIGAAACGKPKPPPPPIAETAHHDTNVGKLVGLVTDSSGQPLSAQVELMESGAKPVASNQYNGRFELKAPPGRYMAVARAQGMADNEQRVKLFNGKIKTLNFQMKPEQEAPTAAEELGAEATGGEEKGVIAGKISDMEGNGLQGKIMAISEAGEKTIVKTGAAGDYLIELPAGTYKFGGTAKGHVTHKQHLVVQAGEVALVDMELEPADGEEAGDDAGGEEAAGGE